MKISRDRSLVSGNTVNFTIMGASACAAFLLILHAAPALAQRASENAVTNAEDAFGGTVGSDATGIYTESDIRGFSPQRAGNIRLNGVYFDQVGNLSYRFRAGSSMRVGLAALNYPFPAPTGIVDYRLRSAGEEQILSLSAALFAYDGFVWEADLQQPVIKEHVSLAAGVGGGRIVQADGSVGSSHAFSFRPIIKSSRFEFSPFVTATYNYDVSPQLIFSSTGAFLPDLVDGEKYLGQTWTRAENLNSNYGALGNVKLLENVSLRAGWFHSALVRRDNYSEIYNFIDTGLPNHTIIADPKQTTSSTSWEAMLSWSPVVHKWQNRVLFGARSRARVTETGGSNFLAYGRQSLGTQVVEPNFVFGAIDRNTVKQTSLMAGYMLERPGKVQLNIGVQKASYEAISRRALVRTSASTDSWLYNGSFSFNFLKYLQIFGGYVRGLEDSGTAPETAANRNEQLAASSTEQWDAGLQVRLGKSQFIASIFQIKKPYFTFDGLNRFTALGGVRHRGVELSLNGHVTDRLQVVAGAVFIDGRVSSAGTLVAIGDLPVGVPSMRVRVDVNYHTDLWGGLTPTATLTYLGERAGSANRFAALNNKQVMVPSSFRLDLGLRSQFSMGGVDTSLRLAVLNIFDERGWKPIASGLYQLDDRRRVTATLIADL